MLVVQLEQRLVVVQLDDLVGLCFGLHWMDFQLVPISLLLHDRPVEDSL